MKRFLFALSILLFSGNVFAESISDIEKQNIKIALDVLKESYKKSEDNYVVSGTSVYYATDMLANGASNKSLQELSRILGNYPIKDINKTLYTNIINAGATLELSNSIWGNGFKDEYKRTLTHELKAEANPLPKNTSVIDIWIKEKTHGKIEELFGSNRTIPSDLYLVNTVYFKDSWFFPFEKENTREGIFHNLNSQDTLTEMMHNTDHYAYMEGETFHSIILPYKNGGEMYIFLPKEGIDFRSFINNFDVSALGNRDLYARRKVNLQIPKFKIEAKTDLKPIFQRLGVNEIFNPNNNDFGKMISLRAYVEGIRQKAIVEVDEEGTTAAAATGIGMKATSISFDPVSYFTVDRPFLFYITKGNFMGIVTRFKEVGPIDYSKFKTATPIRPHTIRPESPRIRPRKIRDRQDKKGL